MLPESDILKHGLLTRIIPLHEWLSDDSSTKRLDNLWAVPWDGWVRLGFTKEGTDRANDW
jgi:hypothetical protein